MQGLAILSVWVMTLAMLEALVRLLQRILGGGEQMIDNPSFLLLAWLFGLLCGWIRSIFIGRG